MAAAGKMTWFLLANVCVCLAASDTTACAMSPTTSQMVGLVSMFTLAKTARVNIKEQHLDIADAEAGPSCSYGGEAGTICKFQEVPEFAGPSPLTWKCCKGVEAEANKVCTILTSGGMGLFTKSFSCATPLAPCDCEGESCDKCAFSAWEEKQKQAEEAQRQKEAQHRKEAEARRVIEVAKTSMSCAGATGYSWDHPYYQNKVQLSLQNTLTGELKFTVTASTIFGAHEMKQLHIPLGRTKVSQGPLGGCEGFGQFRPGDMVRIAKSQQRWKSDSNVFYEVSKVDEWRVRGGCAGTKVSFAGEPPRPAEGGDGIFIHVKSSDIFGQLEKAEGDELVRAEAYLLRQERIRHLRQAHRSGLKLTVPTPACLCSGKPCAHFDAPPELILNEEQVVRDFERMEWCGEQMRKGHGQLDSKAAVICQQTTFQLDSKAAGLVDVGAFQ